MFVGGVGSAATLGGAIVPPPLEVLQPPSELLAGLRAHPWKCCWACGGSVCVVSGGVDGVLNFKLKIALRLSQPHVVGKKVSTPEVSTLHLLTHTLRQWNQ
jgi:hypothetical protein